MNDLAIQSKPTMSSREIAELTGIRHDNVMRACRGLKDSGVSPQIEETPYVLAHNGQTYKEFQLSKRDSLVLVARLSPEFTARIVDRWQELESQLAKPTLPGNYLEALKCLVCSEESRLQLAAVNETLAANNAVMLPKAQFHDAVTESKNCQTIEQVAKVLKTGRNRMFDFLRGAGILIPNSRLPYQRFIDAGYFRIVEIQFTDSTGKSRTDCKPLVTGKGLTYIQKRFYEQPPHCSSPTYPAELIH